jgi:hypothetical protein
VSDASGGEARPGSGNGGSAEPGLWSGCGRVLGEKAVAFIGGARHVVKQHGARGGGTGRARGVLAGGRRTTREGSGVARRPWATHADAASKAARGCGTSGRGASGRAVSGCTAGGACGVGMHGRRGLDVEKAGAPRGAWVRDARSGARRRGGVPVERGSTPFSPFRLRISPKI